MDALSSQANVAGYKAVLIAAREAGRFFPMMTTAAGTVPPAKVLVLGAGVAGLQAIATAKRLGAVVSGFDVRRVAWEQIQSLGGRSLELDFDPRRRGRGRLRPRADRRGERAAARGARRDRRAPGRDHHHRADPGPPGAAADHRRGACRSMTPGSVIVDLAAETRRQLRADRGRARPSSSTASRSSAPLNLPSHDARPRLASSTPRTSQNLLELMIDEEGDAEARLRGRGHRRRLLTHGRRDRATSEPRRGGGSLRHGA